MSSQSHNMAGTNTTAARNGEIDLTSRFSDQMAHLCISEDYSDVTFIVENQRLPAHRVILAARCEYFRAMLYGGLAESGQTEIELNIPLEAFKSLLKYIYSGHISLTQMKDENVLDTLGLANQYGFIELEHSISEYLRQALSLENVCAIVDAARLYGLDSLTNVCYIFMDRNASDLIQHKTFKTLSQESLCGLLDRDSFFAPEDDIFLAVSEWCKHNKNERNIEQVVSYVRLPLMDLKQLFKVVRPSGILDSDKLLDAIEEQITSKILPYRGALWNDENVATAKFGAKTIQGELRTALLDGDTTNYDMEKGYTRHSITDSNDQSIVVELGIITIINHLKLLLWDLDTRSYSYFIEVSVNSKHWERVVDHSEHYCRSWQFLYFPARAVKYIKIVGTHNTVNRVFHAVALEAMYSTSPAKLVNGFLEPIHNVATVELSATVIEGVSRTKNALLGDVKTYDWDSGYTCHQLGSSVILIQLGQPYMIGSLRLLLWDCDDRSYSFYIETSTNQKDWSTVVDKRSEQLKSWQSFTFTPRPIVFIMIVGTYNTANEIFHCVHFECPSQEPNYLKEKVDSSTAALVLSSSSSSGSKQT